jgi:hypothetical protein
VTEWRNVGDRPASGAGGRGGGLPLRAQKGPEAVARSGEEEEQPGSG